ncbi:MAG: hypothetical protein ACYS6K_26725 [Planctomycetota bacterium]|jgi:outer membrane lipoprotein-sorting protein
MKTPLYNDLEKAYEAFNQKHDQLRETLMASLTGTSRQHKQRSKFVHIGAFIGDTIMKSRITKLAAAAVIIIAVLIGISQFGGFFDGSSVAFGEVLGYIQTFSYTFDLTVETTTEKQPSEAFTMQAMVQELGRLRIDCSAPVGKISSITDFNTGKSLLLFHQNQSGVLMEEPVLKMDDGIGGIHALFSKPIENLWNLHDGTQENLGEKQIDGQTVTGFRVFQEDSYFEYDITIWANITTGVPVLVEVLSKPLDTSDLSIKWIMKNFNLDVELDEELFSLEVPAEYTLAYQSDLDELEVETEPSVEAKRIVQMFELWSEGKKNEAVEILLGIDWIQPFEFGKEPYIFSITEKGYISLKAEDQKRAMDEIMAVATTVRQIVYEVLNSGQAAVSAQNYKEAERYFEAGLQLGKLLGRNPESMIIVRLVGIAVEKKTLNEMISLYTTTNTQEKLRAAEEQLRAAEAEAEEIKKKIRGQ